MTSKTWAEPAISHGHGTVSVLAEINIGQDCQFCRAFGGVAYDCRFCRAFGGAARKTGAGLAIFVEIAANCRLRAWLCRGAKGA